MSDNFQYLKEGLVADLIGRVMADYSFDLEKALDIVYSSEIFQKLSDPATLLYKEGPAYIYSFLKDELEKGKTILSAIYCKLQYFPNQVSRIGPRWMIGRQPRVGAGLRSLRR